MLIGLTPEGPLVRKLIFCEKGLIPEGCKLSQGCHSQRRAENLFRGALAKCTPGKSSGRNDAWVQEEMMRGGWGELSVNNANKQIYDKGSQLHLQQESVVPVL